MGEWRGSLSRGASSHYILVFQKIFQYTWVSSFDFDGDGISHLQLKFSLLVNLIWNFFFVLVSPVPSLSKGRKVVIYLLSNGLPKLLVLLIYSTILITDFCGLSPSLSGLFHPVSPNQREVGKGTEGEVPYFCTGPKSLLFIVIKSTLHPFCVSFSLSSFPGQRVLYPSSTPLSTSSHLPDWPRPHYCLQIVPTT